MASGSAASPSNAVSTAYASRYGSSAGFFQSDFLAAPSPYGHDLRPAANVSAPLSATYLKTGGLMCSDCHEPHGTRNFLNLLSVPNLNHPGSFEILLGTHVREAVPVNAANPNPSAAYDAGNISFYRESNISAWCADCHDALAQNTTGASPAHFRGHPSDAEMGALDAHTALGNWIAPDSQPSSGFGTDVGDSAAGIPRLRYGSATGSNTAGANTDTINCLSCHKAHGSRYRYGLVWPYHETGVDMLSGCQQCHEK